MDIPNDYILYDIRSNKDFKGITICGYKRKDVINAFQNSIINNKTEDAIRWLVELHSTGLNKQIWDSFDNIYIKYIHINNPKLFFYLLKRKKEYLSIIKNYSKKHEIFTRNCQEIRNLYAELTAIFSLTKKNNLFLPKSLPSIKNISFEPYEIKKRMIAKNLDYVLDFIHNTTTNEVKLALNEIINNLLYINGTFQNCLFWYLWLEKYMSKNKINNKNNILFENVNLTKDEQYVDHWTFILWKIILSFENKLDKNKYGFIKKMEEIYKSDFKLSFINKKKYYFFISFYIIKNNINWMINLFPMEHLIIQTNANINSMYKNIIKNIESSLSLDTKQAMHKKYNQLFLNEINGIRIEPKKIKTQNLNEEINKVLFTSNPTYDIIKKNRKKNIEDESLKTNNKIEKESLICKNKTERDIIEQKMEQKNKKIEAFSQFISYKKKDENGKKEKKTVLDYYNSEIQYKDITNIRLDNNNNSKNNDINKNKKKSYKNNNYNDTDEHDDYENKNDNDYEDDYDEDNESNKKKKYKNKMKHKIKIEKI